MSLKVYSVEEKLRVITEVMVSERRKASENGTSARGALRYEVLQSIAADLRARQERTRSNPLGDLERHIVAVRASKTSLGYNNIRLIALAEALIGKWPFVSQALEHFGEESAE